METCFHCGDNCNNDTIIHQDKFFCCNGCKTVFTLLYENDLSYYYDLALTPGITPETIEGKFDFLKNETIVAKLLDFDEQGTQIVTLLIPAIHCSSCIWVLENLNKLNPSIKTSQVSFPKKTVHITFNSADLSLNSLVSLLCRLGYEPSISLEDYSTTKKTIDKSLIYKLGVAGFAFGNIMFLSFPEYFESNEFWLEQYKHVFRWLMFSFAVPAVFYSASDYFTSAIKGLRSKVLTIDVPIAIGISVLFLRSFIEIAFDLGSGFLDSLAGLIFFLLLGKLFQQKTYSFLSFERDYKSYFPIAVTRIKKASRTTPSPLINEEQVQIHEIKKGDRILIRNRELIPTDGILVSGSALIDYSFVTGEAKPVSKSPGDKLYAGGKQQAATIEIEVLKSVEQSYLTQLWNNDVFKKSSQSTFQSLTDAISKRFTIGILTIAFVACLFWLAYDSSKALNVLTAVLIVACPCAIALAAPFTLGNLLRVFGINQFYVKDAKIIEKMAHINTVVFDKTGTLTSNSQNVVTYEGIELTNDEKVLLISTIRASNHPLSRALYDILKKNDIKTLDGFQEDLGQGIVGTINNQQIKVGSYSFVETGTQKLSSPTFSEKVNRTTVHISANNKYKGCYVFYNEYREGVKEVFDQLSKNKQIVILSGDNDGEEATLKKLLPNDSTLLFDQKPEDKLNYIKELQRQGQNVMMIGDGLNDSGALAQSNVGIVISENVNVFSPACDGILAANQFKNLMALLTLSKQGIRIIKYAFVFSIFYNIIGLGFAITGNLEPIVAAILMPLSSISIVVFTTMCTFIAGRKLTNKTKFER